MQRPANGLRAEALMMTVVIGILTLLSERGFTFSTCHQAMNLPALLA